MYRVSPPVAEDDEGRVVLADTEGFLGAQRTGHMTRSPVVGGEKEQRVGEIVFFLGDLHEKPQAMVHESERVETFNPVESVLDRHIVRYDTWDKPPIVRRDGVRLVIAGEVNNREEGRRCFAQNPVGLFEQVHIFEADIKRLQ